MHTTNSLIGDYLLIKLLAWSTISLVFIIFIPDVTLANCGGCCSSHGGVVCSGGVTQCRDGQALSETCRSNGCNKCGSTPKKKTKQEPVIEKPILQKQTEMTCHGHVALGIPGPEDQLLCREGYALGYSFKKKAPMWVAYMLTSESVKRKFKRSSSFREDEELPVEYRALLSDYKGSGYDRGHMAPSATVDSSHNAMEESFLLSNMTPQLSGFNRKGWRALEKKVRDWTNERNELYVVTGALFEGKPKTIGDGVYVPSHLFKVIYDWRSQEAIGFIVPHKAFSKVDLPGFIVSVDEVESRSGLDFNPELEEVIEERIEADVSGLW